MIVLLQGYANHSNRLFQTLHLEAFCLENKIKFWNLDFLDMAPLYEIRYSRLTPILQFVLRGLKKCHLIQTLKMDDFSKELDYQGILNNQGITLVEGWAFRAPELTQKYQDYFIKRYSLRPSVKDKFSTVKQFEELRQKEPNRIFVAVHIRRKDYKDWSEGKYFYSNEDYLGYIKKLDQKIQDSQQTSPLFFIFSDEETGIPQTENRIIERNPWFIDQ